MKYIMEFSDEPWEDLDGGIYYKCKEPSYLSISGQAIAHLKKADDVFDSFVKAGQKQAWDAARKIFKMSNEQRCRLLDVETETLAESMDWMTVDDAFRAIEGSKIRVGDEVIEDDNKKAVVTCSYEDTGEGVDLMYSTGETGYVSNIHRLVKTGRHFDLEGILKQMMEE